MKIRNNIVRALAASAFGLTLTAAGIATAGTATAASLPKACKGNVWVEPQKQVADTAVNLRSGPGTKYTSKGILYKNTRFSEYCTNWNYNWGYGKVASGPNKGKWGWVSTFHLHY
ncbi:hypothetical protein SAMN04487981_10258 [Streptomyces sp. cf386]|uniref:SH3 domain-containing protein n=1 Tax=Streptomyces sp. cf386 TaxID=1761904 RepID=UPI0008859B34|nr:SH3 domain-containing protein [Streptomyces sp. cf386]SDM63188.1 hypothetical protein SAMN04487981_10258 [Streptomyces sp. cf386]